MTSTGTTTASFTITEARYVGAKVATDLRLLNSLYGHPALDRIDDFAEEVAVLLRDGYLNYVDYGFKDHSANSWKLRLRYTATAGGQLRDSRPGSFPARVAVSGYSFYSYLVYSAKYHALSATQKQNALAGLAITRVTADEPSAGAGTTTGSHGYARNGVGVSRDVYVAA
jgi:Bacterial HORMA domain family 1